jgi:aspartate/methionine/tyrosine aminotransferase
VVTNLHNPTSVLTPDAVLREVGDLARSVGAHVLVDEVYLDAVYENTPRTAYRLGPEFIVTSSLTKVYGLSGLRCGWILAQPDLARAMWRLNDLFGSIPAHPAELLSVAAFEQLDSHPRAGAQGGGGRSGCCVGRASRPAADGYRVRPRTAWGTTAFLRLHGGNVEAFLARLRTEYETTAVPGRFFEMPDHFRIGMGVNTEMFREGLRRLDLALGSATAP